MFQQYSGDNHNTPRSSSPHSNINSSTLSAKQTNHSQRGSQQRFPLALRQHAQAVFDHSMLADVQPDGAIVFSQQQLVLDTHLRQRIDSFFLLQPELDLDGIKYLLSKDAVFFNDGIFNNERFEQLEDVLDAYQKLHDDLAQRPLQTPSNKFDVVATLQQLSAIRKQILGEELAAAFYAQEENFIAKKIQQQPRPITTAEQKAQQAADQKLQQILQQQ